MSEFIKGVGAQALGEFAFDAFHRDGDKWTNLVKDVTKENAKRRKQYEDNINMTSQFGKDAQEAYHNKDISKLKEILFVLTDHVRIFNNTKQVNPRELVGIHHQKEEKLYLEDYDPENKDMLERTKTTIDFVKNCISMLEDNKRKAPKKQIGFNIPASKKNRDILTKFFNGMRYYFDEEMNISKAIDIICSNKPREVIRNKVCVQLKGRKPKSDDIIIFNNDVQANEAEHIFEKLKINFKTFPAKVFIQIGRDISKANSPILDGYKKDEIDAYYDKIQF